MDHSEPSKRPRDHSWPPFPAKYDQITPQAKKENSRPLERRRRRLQSDSKRPNRGRVRRYKPPGHPQQSGNMHEIERKVETDKEKPKVHYS